MIILHCPAITCSSSLLLIAWGLIERESDTVRSARDRL